MFVAAACGFVPLHYRTRSIADALTSPHVARWGFAALSFEHQTQLVFVSQDEKIDCLHHYTDDSQDSQSNQ